MVKAQWISKRLQITNPTYTGLLPYITHTQFQNSILQLATLLGWKHFSVYDSRKSDRGWPDLVLVRPPRLLFAELKVKKDKVKPAQQEWLDVLAASGTTEVFVWRPSDWETIEDILK